MSPPFGEYKLLSLILLDALRPRTAFYPPTLRRRLGVVTFSCPNPRVRVVTRF
ncbi:hypothetical protein M6B38_136475 [Iris pallida]|uniref:Uncharacterized protein n=1 Tax=Iris pallida TaxID=29817 RepID=A0AAX6FFJ6_IRIPA|nr:hypothetical protein M6B38_136475 [Iris pallida]